MTIGELRKKFELKRHRVDLGPADVGRASLALVTAGSIAWCSERGLRPPSRRTAAPTSPPMSASGR